MYLMVCRFKYPFFKKLLCFLVFSNIFLTVQVLAAASSMEEDYVVLSRHNSFSLPKVLTGLLCFLSPVTAELSAGRKAFAAGDFFEAQSQLQVLPDDLEAQSYMFAMAENPRGRVGFDLIDFIHKEATKEEVNEYDTLRGRLHIIGAAPYADKYEGLEIIRSSGHPNNPYGYYLWGLINEQGIRGWVVPNVTEAILAYRSATRISGGYKVASSRIKQLQDVRSADITSDGEISSISSARYKNKDDLTKGNPIEISPLKPLDEQEATDAPDKALQYYVQGEKYESGRGRDEKAASIWYLRAAEENFAKAEFALGVMHERGIGVSQDIVEAAKWYQRAAEHGIKEAQFALGLMHETGRGVKQDIVEAVKWCQRAAEQGYAPAQDQLGDIFSIDRESDARDITKAVKYYRSAAEQGYPMSQLRLGWIYKIGAGVEVNAAEAIKWYRLAAEQGYADAQFNLGDIFQNGIGDIKPDVVEAIKWYLLAATQGSSASSLALEHIYADGKLGAPLNHTEAFRWLSRASDQVDEDLIAIFKDTGTIISDSITGAGTPYKKNDPKAVKWHYLAADRGNAWAQYQLGVIHETSRLKSLSFCSDASWVRAHVENYGSIHSSCSVINRNYKEAAQWYRRAADQGLKEAQIALGSMYENGRGVEKNITETIILYELVAEQGEAVIQAMLGDIYAEGKGVERNDKKAAEWYRLAAEQGHADAQYRLGYMYEHGRGVEKEDRKAAYAWYKRAAKAGHVTAMFALPRFIFD